MAQSALAMAYARSYGLPVTVLRCSNLYGDAPCHGPRHGWLTWFCISAALDWTIDIQGTGYQTRDMLFCSDVASAVFASFARMDAVFGRVFNIGGGSPNTISVLEAYNMLSSIAGHSLSKKSSPGRLNEDKLFVTDHREFSSITGWQPAIDVKSGMERIYSWALHNADNLRQIYQKYSPESCI
jgi:CDP-paratose 2-epimerase